jgi:tRNA 2-selenouridine synthase
MRVWNTLRRFDPAQVVYVEAESKKVGNVSVPETLMETMRASDCIDLTLPLQERVELLMEDYAFFAQDPEQFCNRLTTLTEVRGKVVIDQWQLLVRSGQIHQVVQELLAQHYDPTYARSVERNFRCWPDALKADLKDHHLASLQALAKQLITQANQIPA